MQQHKLIAYYNIALYSVFLIATIFPKQNNIYWQEIGIYHVSYNLKSLQVLNT